MSHEIRTLLHGILGFLNNLTELDSVMSKDNLPKGHSTVLISCPSSG